MNINYPETTTYFIATNGEAVHCGVVEPSQCMTTAMPDVETFTNEDEYQARLTERGISNEISPDGAETKIETEVEND